jgi:hypothetical protein
MKAHPLAVLVFYRPVAGLSPEPLHVREEPDLLGGAGRLHYLSQ